MATILTKDVEVEGDYKYMGSKSQKPILSTRIVNQIQETEM